MFTTLGNPFAFYSDKLSPAQQMHSPYDRELLAVYEAIKYFQHMVEGPSFVISKDKKPHLRFPATQR